MFTTCSIICLAYLQASLCSTISHLMLTGEKRNKHYILSWIPLCVWNVIGNFFLTQNILMVILSTLIFAVIWIATIFFLYKDSLGSKVFVISTIALTNLFSHGLYRVLITVIYRTPVAESELSFERIGAMVIVWILQYILGLGLIIVIRYVYKRGAVKGMLPMFLLPVSQLFYMLGALKVDYIMDSSYAVFLIAGQILGCGISLYWLYWVCAENRQKELEAKMKDMQETIEKEKAHFTEIEQRRETLNNLRQGMNLQIQDVQQLMEEKKREEAVKILDELTEMLHSTKEYTFCTVPIINAVLEEKGKECKELGIDFEAEIKIPFNSGIKEMAYCSIFSNLMDNAIRGAKEYSEEQNVPGFIRISAIYEAGFCVIKTVNNSKKPDAQPRKGHGKGTVILMDIAEYYGGTYEGTFENNIYTAVVTLRK